VCLAAHRLVSSIFWLHVVFVNFGQTLKMIEQNKERRKMSGISRGKGAQGLGKGGSKRHRKVLRDNIQGITKPASKFYFRCRICY
jgi:hypothetical protein